MTVQHARHYRFNVEQYQRLAHEGYIDPAARVELIDGEIVEMSPIGSRHNAVVDRIAELLMLQLAGSFIVRTQGSIRLNDVQAPHPDIAVLKRRADYYADALPNPEDVLLVIEVADTSLVYDREAKAEMYAQNHVEEYWLIDLIQNQALLLTDPTPLGYQGVETKRREERWTSHSVPSLTVSGKDIFA